MKLRVQDDRRATNLARVRDERRFFEGEKETDRPGRSDPFE
jgi:hypothetical protein